MKSILAALAVTLTASALPALADEAPAAPADPLSFNVSLTSDYRYRGISQTRLKPALQGGIDYAFDSGFYIGTWGSSISWLSDGNPSVNASLELDIYGGYKNSFSEDWSYDVGILTYNYPGSYPRGYVKPDTTEIYGQLGFKWLTAKYSYVVSNHIFGFTTPSGGKTDGSGYFDLTATYDLGDGLGITGHGGHQSIKGFSQASYTDWKIGVTKDFGIGTAGLYYLSTDAKGGVGQPYRNAFNRDLGQSRVLLTFTKTL